MSEVLKVEEQQVIAKIQERQTLQGEKMESDSERAVCLNHTWNNDSLVCFKLEKIFFYIRHFY